jgi:hypothetical protein
MYLVQHTLEMMTLHVRNKSIDGKVCHVPNIKTWQHIDNTWLDFATELINVKLGLATYGMHPLGEKKMLGPLGQCYT